MQVYILHINVYVYIGKTAFKLDKNDKRITHTYEKCKSSGKYLNRNTDY